MKCHIKKLSTFLMVCTLLLMTAADFCAATNHDLPVSDTGIMRQDGPLPAGFRVPCASGPAVPPEAWPEEQLGGPSDALPEGLDDAARLDVYCLRASYPEIAGMVTDDSGLWLLVGGGRRVLYARHADSGSALSHAGSGNGEKGWAVDVRSSMADAYPLEPERPDTPYGVSPGRRRSYDLLGAIYGHNASEVGRQVRQTTLLGQPLRLSASAARALGRADARLAVAVGAEPHLKDYLKVHGGFVWRRIAGETRLSPHAYGIAVDLSPRLAPYWRWNKLRPHPMQHGYPFAIVDAMEQAGFIWGGKWHEYDIMHFEYRPEIICKARMLQARRGQGGAGDGPAHAAGAVLFSAD